MFCITKGSQTVIEPLNKFKFIAKFDTFTKDEVSNPLNVLNYDPKMIHIAVKKIDAPKINFEFERAYANEYVHYFQNGSIHWEPITISFIDSSQTPFGSNFDDLRGVLNDYINRMTQETNRTNVIDLPVLCNQITIVSLGIFTKDNYPTLNSAKILQTGASNDNTGSLEAKFTEETNKMNNSFIIKKPRITKIDFGSFDYNSDDINEISITVVPEWCEAQSDFLKYL